VGREDWTLVRPPEPRDELLERLLVELALTPDRKEELVAALGDRLREVGGGWFAGAPERHLVTLWWDPSPAPRA
jgi:hypothetical protein